VRGLCVSDVFISDKSLSCCSHDLLLTDIRQEQCEMILLAPHLVSKLTQRWAAALQEILIQHTDQIQCPFWWGALQLALGFSTISWQSWKGYPQTYIDRNILPYNYRFSSTMLMQAYDSNSAFQCWEHRIYCGVCWVKPFLDTRRTKPKQYSANDNAVKSECEIELEIFWSYYNIPSTVTSCFQICMLPFMPHTITIILVA